MEVNREKLCELGSAPGCGYLLLPHQMKTASILAFASAAILGTFSPALPAALAAPAGHYALPASDDGLPGSGPVRHYDWFTKLWETRRAAWGEHAEFDHHAVVFLGDSITQGWGDYLGNAFPGMKVANRGISGDTTRGMLARLDEDVLSLDPAAVVMLMGTNDLEEGADPETIAGNVKLIIAAIKKHDPHTPVILCQVFPSAASKKRPVDKIKKINELYLAAVKGDRQVTYVETWQQFANAQGDAKPEEFPDLLHPNATGYAKWAAGLRPVFATLGFLELQDDRFTLEPGYVSLFNGHDLTGWGFKTNNFDGLTKSSDGRYVAKHGRLIVTTPPEYRRIEQLWTTKSFPKNFSLKLEFRATPYADSGVFLRDPQLQCRDYWTAGPYKSLKAYKPQDWNEMEVTVKDNVAYCTCNGEVLEQALKLPATGPIGLEGDRGQMEYRRIRLKELP